MHQYLPVPQLVEAVRPAMIAEFPRLSQRLGVKVALASETFQHTGSFKFRAAYNVAASVGLREIGAIAS